MLWCCVIEAYDQKVQSNISYFTHYEAGGIYYKTWLFKSAVLKSYASSQLHICWWGCAVFAYLCRSRSSLYLYELSLPMCAWRFSQITWWKGKWRNRHRAKLWCGGLYQTWAISQWSLLHPISAPTLPVKPHQTDTQRYKGKPHLLRKLIRWNTL